MPVIGVSLSKPHTSKVFFLSHISKLLFALVLCTPASHALFVACNKLDALLVPQVVQDSERREASKMRYM